MIEGITSVVLIPSLKLIGPDNRVVNWSVYARLSPGIATWCAEFNSEEFAALFANALKDKYGVPLETPPLESSTWAKLKAQTA